VQPLRDHLHRGARGVGLGLGLGLRIGKDRIQIIRSAGYQTGKEHRVQDTRIPGYQARKLTHTKSEGQGQLTAGFEKRWVWQKAHQLMREIHEFCKSLPRRENLQLRDQIERSSASVCDNIAEGYAAYYYKEKVKGFYIARKEAGETQNHVRKLTVKEYLDLTQSQRWVEQLSSTKKL
jgi:four helix bundle protein